jgi:hypothetical protein
MTKIAGSGDGSGSEADPDPLAEALIRRFGSVSNSHGSATLPDS